MVDTTNVSLTSTPTYKTAFRQADSKKSPISSRLQALAGNAAKSVATSQSNGVSPVIPAEAHPKPTVQPITVAKSQPAAAAGQQTSFSAIQFSSFVPIKSTPSTPNSTSASPAVKDVAMSPSIKSLAGTGFQLTLNTNNSSGNNLAKDRDEDTRNSFPSPALSGGMPSPAMSRDGKHVRAYSYVIYLRSLIHSYTHFL